MQIHGQNKALQNGLTEFIALAGAATIEQWRLWFVYSKLKNFTVR